MACRGDRVVWQVSSGREAEAQGPVVPPGDGDFEVGEAGVDEDGVVAAQVEGAGDGVRGDVQGAGGVQEVPPDGVGGGAFVAWQLAGEQPVEVAGDDGEGGVQVDVERDAGGQRVEAEAGDAGIQLVLDEHPLGVPGEQVFGRGGILQVVGDEQGGLVAADVADGDLADRRADALESDHVFVQMRVAVAAGAVDGVVFPRAGGQGGEAGELGLAALAQGEPGDAAGGQLVEDLAGGELGVEDQQAGLGSGGRFPVVGEGDDLAGLLGLGDVGVGVDHLSGGVVAGEEGEHRAGALGPGGHVVLFQDRVVAVVADGVEVAVEAFLAAGQAKGAQSMWWARGTRVAAASSSVPADCQADSRLVAG